MANFQPLKHSPSRLLRAFWVTVLQVTRSEHSGARLTRASVIPILAVAVVFVVAFLVRWATLSSLSGDDHYLLWTATSLLNGDRPIRDFVELGAPLYSAMSALAQAITGYRVIGEVALGTTLVALAFAISFYLAWRASRSLAVAAGLTGMALLVVTQRELYSYTKIFVYPLGLWLCWRYIDRPTLLRAGALAFGVAVAFGYRHDHGAYVGVGAAAAILAAHWPDGPRRIILAWLRFGAALVLLLSPYLALIQVNEGIVQYFQHRMRLARVDDATSRRPVPFTVDRAAPAHWFRIDPPRPARVFVEWKPEVASATRIALEKQYSLTNGLDPKKRLYEYLLTNVSPDNLRALVADARIVDRGGLSVTYREAEAGSKVLDEVVATEQTPADAPPAARAVVEIQWTDDLGEGERASLERRYGLLDNRNTWEYALADLNTDNIRAIVQNPRVYETGLIERDTYRPMEESWLIRVQRSLPFFRISVAPRYLYTENAGAALHYLLIALPYIMFIMLAADRIRGKRSGQMSHASEKMFAAAVMMAVANFALLRRVGYFADHVAVATVLGACVLGHAFGAAQVQRRAAARIVSGVIAGVALVVVTLATITYASPLGVASLAGMNDGGIWNKSVRLFQTYSTSPPIDAYAPRGTTGDRGLIRYIYECTRPDDRVWVLSDLFAFPYYAERRVVGHIYWKDGMLANPEFERRMIEKVDSAEVPIIIGLGGPGPLAYLESYPLVHQYVAQRYLNHYAIPEEDLQREQVFWLLTDSRRQQTGTYELFGLPCFK